MTTHSDSQWPNYKSGSIGNLMASLRTAFGGTSAFDPLPGLCVNALKEAPCVVLLVIDGLGQALMRRGLAPEGFLRQKQTHTLHSVFPTTTASAITTLMTGLSPAEHGVSGWFMYERHLGQLIVPLPFLARATRQSLTAQGIYADQVFPNIKSWVAPAREHHVLLPKAIAESAFTRHFSPNATLNAYRDAQFKSLCKELEKMVRKTRASRFCYAYWSELDSLQHQVGPSAPEASAHLAMLEQSIQSLCERLADSGAVLLLTADHGQCDVPPQHWRQIQDYSRLQQCLSLPLSGEPRACFAYVKPRKWREFQDLVTGEYADWLSIYDSQDLLDSGRFGPGEINPVMRDRVGDFTLLPAPGITLNEWLPMERKKGYLGQHSGLTLEELEVPLCTLHLDG